MFCRWICSGSVVPVYTFQRLSSNKYINISLPKETTCSDAICSLSNYLRKENNLIDITEYGKPVDRDAKLCLLSKVISVVVHQEVRIAHAEYVTNKPDMINDWEDEPRVEMSCGHAINPDSLYGYCWNLLLSNMAVFRCPARDNNRSCNLEWDFPEVALKACLSEDERILFETRLNFIWLNKNTDTSQCPTCLAYCQRQDPKSASVQCLYCKKAGKVEYIFCWFCLQLWMDNHTCDIGDAESMLQSCDLKVIGDYENCPSVRACPNCKSFIEHDDKCKKMRCHVCNEEFCFVCLLPVINGNYQCGTTDNQCKIAPKQSFS